MSNKATPPGTGFTRTSATVTDERQSPDRILRVRNLDVWFEMDRGAAKVMDDVDMDIYRNEILGIVGESGSGKSMFASAMLDAVPEPGETTGSIRYYPDDGRDPIDVLDLSKNELKSFRWEEISMVFQGAMSSFNPTMTIGGHFEETIVEHGMDLDSQMDHARNLIADLYLDPDRVLDAYPHELSGGMKQRALIALSLVLEPDVLVMDEPTAALDLLMQQSIKTMLATLRDEYDLTIIFITHDLPLVAGLVDRLAVIYAFDFVEAGTRDEVLLDAAHPYTRALLSAVPSLDTPVDQMKPIEGSSPDPVKRLEGCPYHPRCPLADERCVESDPDHFSVSERHSVACFYSDEAAEAVPYTLESELEIDLHLLEGQLQRGRQ
ncbi:ABC transporter ATP-binding protein [Haloarchaeobius sp. HME9146]|uniref:ABC transporter ATP-binding protein n=1 Tax=Haloarchaeobius sp. HME9146 TaxID=2978732 RepID=UPI0021C12279|nr:ABC transporter ATP-binding protein [Haloarchaeobius sp. HME9146]MCT9098026.1 ABC transporter ATP-binding protein [Haloarchaeobius sp. HME9146]